jgi:protein gp37
MSENTKIEWADHTFNPWIGCTKVGPGCDNCYAKADFEDRRHRVVWGAGHARIRTKTWGDPVRWNKQADAFFAVHGRRQRVFCASLADVFDNEVDPLWRADLFWLIKQTPNLDWLLLTKRIGNARLMMCDAISTIDPMAEWVMPLSNIWLGATIVNQEEADRDIPKLLEVPATKRFLSIEPLLGPVNLDAAFMPCENWGDDIVMDPETGAYECCRKCDYTGISNEMGIDWVIVGGESGHNARPMHPDWVRGLRDQCQTAGVPFLFKQWGEWTPGENVERVRGTVDTAFLWNDEWKIYPLNLATDGGHIDDEPDLYRVGKKAAGRHLDGEIWNGVPL